LCFYVLQIYINILNNQIFLKGKNTSRILRSFFGADVDQLPMFWIVAPVVAMTIQFSVTDT